MSHPCGLVGGSTLLPERGTWIERRHEHGIRLMTEWTWRMARRRGEFDRPDPPPGGADGHRLNRPGSGGGSDSTERWSHASTEEVSERTAGTGAAHGCRVDVRRFFVDAERRS